MAFAIVADLPLGTYRGAGADGRAERIPSVARLHSALLCAAGFGPRAIEASHDSLQILEADAEALRWLEDHPPDSVHIPALEVNTGGPVAYRADGTWTKTPKSGTPTIAKLAKTPGAGTSVDGTFVWIWKQDPPEPVRAALAELCPDVPYLGTSESPVRLTAMLGDGFPATHDLDLTAGLFTTGGTGIDRPTAGRVRELAAAHRAATGAPPSAARDKYTTSERSHSAVPPRESVETAWYSPHAASASDIAGPWPQAITVPLDSPIPEADRIEWAVAVHRALIRLIGFGAPPMITGAYLGGAQRPANRLALHLLGPAMPAVERGPSLVLLVPAGTEPADLDVLRYAVENLTSVRGPRGKTIRLDVSQLRVLDGSRFWTPSPPGTIRLWRTVPAAIPDTRGSRDADWNFAHAALLSVGFVWKDSLPRISGRGEAYHRGLAAAVTDAGVAVVHARAVRTSDVRKYVHKINEHAVVRPYTAVLSLGSLAGSCAVQAIGQSRHLGGGLLVPFDVPEGTLAEDIGLSAEGRA
jgi:CRISPR-associated protein Csb2